MSTNQRHRRLAHELSVVKERNHRDDGNAKRMKISIIAIFQNGKQGDSKTMCQLANELDIWFGQDSKTNYVEDCKKSQIYSVNH